MCLGIPGKVTQTHQEHGVPMGKVDFGGVSRPVCLAHVPEVRVGEYVLVHVGFALSRLDEEEAKQVFSFLEKMNELEELGPTPAEADQSRKDGLRNHEEHEGHEDHEGSRAIS